MKEVQKIGGQKALNALNTLSVRYLRNVPGRCPKKKKVTKEIKKRGEATKISCPIPHEKLRRRSERRRLKGRFSFRSVDFFTKHFTNRNNDSQPEPVKRTKKPVLVDVVEDDDRIGIFLYYCHAYLL